MWEPWFWAVWAIIGLAIELRAVFNTQRGDTLSEQVWTYITQPASRVKSTYEAWLIWLGRVVIIVFLGWLIGHFAFGWWST